MSDMAREPATAQPTAVAQPGAAVSRLVTAARRDYFAATALHALLRNAQITHADPVTTFAYVGCAYLWADEMIKHRDGLAELPGIKRRRKRGAK